MLQSICGTTPFAREQSGYGGGVKLTLADAATRPLATLVAVTETVCVEAMLAGAVYKPVLSTAPTPLGATVQVTAMLPLDTLATAAANCCVWDAPRVTEEGVTLTDTGG